MRSRQLALGCALGVVLALTGCGTTRADRHPTSHPPEQRLLTPAELRESLLTADIVGDGFRAQRPALDLASMGPGCLNVFDAVTRVSFPLNEEQVVIRPDDEADRFPNVFNASATFGTTEDAEVALPAMRAKLAGCTEVDVTDDDGYRMHLSVRTDDDRVSDEVDDEVNVTARGAAAYRGRSRPLTLSLRAVQIGNNVLYAGFITSATSPVEGESEAVARAAVARMLAVAAGKAPPQDQHLDLGPDGFGSTET